MGLCRDSLVGGGWAFALRPAPQTLKLPSGSHVELEPFPQPPFPRMAWVEGSLYQGSALHVARVSLVFPELAQ